MPLTEAQPDKADINSSCKHSNDYYNYAPVREEKLNTAYIHKKTTFSRTQRRRQ